MNNNSWFKKENPFQTVIGLGGGATGFGAYSSSAAKVYVDEVFNTYLYEGSNEARDITNGIDLSSGGMVWIKQRDDTARTHSVWDTERGVNKYLETQDNTAEQDTLNSSYGLKTFNSDGFTLGLNDSSYTNALNTKIASWAFKEQKGFFDIVKFTGDGTAGRTISHSLECKPGMILVKRTDTAADWAVYHSSNGATKVFYLNSAGGVVTDSEPWNDTEPTSSVFTVGDHAMVNASSATYIAYLFAGANATRWSDMLSPASGTFDYPAERAFNGKLESNPNRLRTSGNYILVTMTISPAITVQAGQSVIVYGEDAAIGNPYGYSGTATVTIDGTTYTSSTGDTHTFSHSGQLTQITYQTNSTGGRTYLEGIRVNGDLLTDGSFFVDGNPNYTAGEESKFGEDADQSIIKCGSYVGQSGANSINLDWEPQWVMIKNIDSAENWVIVDCIRPWNNIASGAAALFASSTTTESTYGPWGPTATGWELDLNQREIDQNGQNYIYVAIRRPDGYVGKPASAGTDVFAMDYGNASTTIPAFDSNFPVDFGLQKTPTTATDWAAVTRLMGPKELKTNDNSAEASGSAYVWDSNVGYTAASWADSGMLSWMFKRGQGFDVVTYTGTAVARSISHSLNAVPQMVWIKHRSGGSYTWNWVVGHIGLNGGTNPWHYYLTLNNDDTETDNANRWNDTAPTSSVFTIGDVGNVNESGSKYLALLFSSVEGISKVGYYTGNDTSQSISLGFQPRFLILKNATSTEKWYVLDTTRGWVSGADEYMSLNTNYAQVSSNTFGEPTATGFDISGSDNWNNANGETFIYYAHA